MSLLRERIMMNRKSDKRYMEKLSKSLDELVQELDPDFDPWNQECLENKREQCRLKMDTMENCLKFNPIKK